MIRRKKQSGFAALLLLSILPISISLLMLIFFLKAWFSPQQQALQICRTGLLQTLNQTAIGMKQLLHLNSEVLYLRQERKQAELELQMAHFSANPAAIAWAQLQLESSLQKQQVLRSIQQEKLEQLHIQLLLGRRQTEDNIRKALNLTQGQYLDSFSYQAVLPPSSSAAPISLVAVAAPDMGPPTYEPETDFSEKQRVHINWKSSLQYINKGASSWFSGDLNKQDTCAASLQLQGNSIRPVLSADKSSLSSF